MIHMIHGMIQTHSTTRDDTDDTWDDKTLWYTWDNANTGYTWDDIKVHSHKYGIQT